MNNKNLLLIIGCLLLGVGLFQPNFSTLLDSRPSLTLSVPKPNNLEGCDEVTKSIRGISSYDAKRLASLYMDIASLIELDNEDQVIQTTEDIRQANSLTGSMLKLNIKGKYPDLPEKAKQLIVNYIGDDNIPLNANLRIKAAEAFRALAWACNQGAK